MHAHICAALTKSPGVLFPAAYGALFEIVAMCIEGPRATPMNTRFP